MDACYRCMDGMLGEGTFHTECLPNGTWSHPVPKCLSEYSSCITQQIAAMTIVVCVLYHREHARVITMHSAKVV